MTWRLRSAVVATVAAAAAMLLPAAPAHASTTFNPVADSYVDASNAGTNYGAQPYLRVDGDPLRRGYLRFTVQGVGSTTSAVLKIFAESGSHDGLQLRTVANNTWAENTITFANAPPLGPVVETTGSFPGGTWLTFHVSSVVTGDGTYNFALTTDDNTAVKITSDEGVNRPQLITPAPPSPTPFVISRVGSSYQAQSQTTGTTYTGTLKFVGESAVADLSAAGGGVVQFTAGTFDFGTEFFKFFNLEDVTFEGAGIDATVVRNSTSALADTEPFNFTGADRVTIRNLTVWAGGAIRNTSDALDFDRGNNVLVENVKVAASRGRGIVFDGKNSDWTSVNNTVRNCVIADVPSDGIELLASSNNRIEGCTITNTGGHGIQMVKSSPTSDQPNKKSSDNVITANLIDQAGQDGINITGGDRNQVTGNTVTNSSDATSGRDGIRITPLDSVTCDDNTVANNTATDNQTPKTQRYGLNIAGAACNRTIVGPANQFAGNLTGTVRDTGTGTIFR